MRLVRYSFVAACAVFAFTSPAAAKCTRLAFSVNDYGKEGPIKDAKELLDKHIAEQMTQRGVAKYTVGKKDVSCELFLDFIVFDEHTCKAEATVCWGDNVAPGATAVTSPAGTSPLEAAAAKPAAKEAKEAKDAKAGPAAAKPAKTAKATPAKTDEAAPVKTVDTPEEAPVSVDDAAVETAAPETAETGTEEPPVPLDTGVAEAPAPAAATETGAIEKYAAPKRIVIPDPIQVKRGVPVDPAAEPEPPPPSSTP